MYTRSQPALQLPLQRCDVFPSFKHTYNKLMHSIIKPGVIPGHDFLFKLHEKKNHDELWLLNCA